MRIRKLAPSGRVEGRWLCHLEDGTILRLGESEVVAFGLGTGKELSGAELSALTEAARAAQVREKAVELLVVVIIINAVSTFIAKRITKG